MKRRSFLKQIVPLGLSPWLLNGIPIRAMASGLQMTDFDCAEIADRVLVIVQLHGGNDGANMFLPVDQYNLYKALRPKIGIKDSGARRFIHLDQSLPLSQQVGLHPDLTGLKSLYDSGMLHIIQGVSYGNTNKSHFKSSNIWLAGGDASSGTGAEESGWMGRYLDYRFPNYPYAFPTTEMPDPLALEFDSKTISLGFHKSQGIPMGLSLSNDPTDFYNLVSGLGGAPPGDFPLNRYGDQLQYLVNVLQDSNTYGDRLFQLFAQGNNTVNYPDSYHSPVNNNFYTNKLAPQLRTVARLISGGCKTKIYLVRLQGFDTHVHQTLNNDPSKGIHATLLYHLSEAMQAFQTDLINQGLADRVMTVSFSEFGRQVAENANFGTDHGTLAPMMVMGRGVEPGISGTNPDYANLAGNSFAGQQFDYRQVFTTLLQDWLGGSDSALGYTGFGAFSNQKIGLINSNYLDATGTVLNYVADPNCFESSFPVGLNFFQATVEDQYRVKLEWQTSSELNNSHFTIERASDGRFFEPIEQIDGAGTSQSIHNYHSYDEQPLNGVSYYRLKQTDFDGSFEYHDTVMVQIDPSASHKIAVAHYPNPADDELHLVFTSAQAVEVQFRLLDVQGRIVRSKQLSLKTGKNELSLVIEDLSSGIYYGELTTSTTNAFSFQRLAYFRQLVR